jgi:hypothetical protein
VQNPLATSFSVSAIQGLYSGRTYSHKLNTAVGMYALYGSDMTKNVAFKDGDRLVFSGRVNAANMGASATGFTVSASFAGKGDVRPVNTMPLNGDYLFSAEFAVPVGAGNLNVTCYVQDLGTYTFNNFTILNRTAMDAIWKAGVQVVGTPYDTTGTYASDSALLAWAYSQSWSVTSATRDANGATTTANIVWPDGTPGVFTADTLSTAYPGEIDAWHVTYVNPLITKTLTQSAVTRDTNGAIIAEPALLVV